MRRLLLSLLFLLPVASASAQNPRAGVVWDPPANDIEAAADLRAIRASGFGAVRTGPVSDEALLTLADTLGLSFYQELPIVFPGPGQIDARTAANERLMEELLAAAEGHRSARHFGVVFGTGAPGSATCDEIGRLASFGKRRSVPGTIFYYVSWTPGMDRCADRVDLVLVDGPRHDDAIRSLDSWTSATPAGVAATGTWVDLLAAPGLLVPRSEERQAQFIGESLIDILDRDEVPVVFVYRWQDPGTAARYNTFQPAPFGRQYGLHDEAGRARKARAVVEGLLLENRTAFVLSGGMPPSAGAPWSVLVGWAVIALLILLVGLSPRFRGMIPRYFLAHGFYRHAVHEGREIPGLVTAALLILFGVIMGLLFAQASGAILESVPGQVFWHRSSAGIRTTIDSIQAQPLLVTVLGGSIGVGALVVWLTVWSTAVRRRMALSASQALILAVWPRWPMLGLLVVMMVMTPADGHEPTSRITLVLTAAWLVVALWSTIRTNIDLARIARVGKTTMSALWMLSPVILLLAMSVVLFLMYPEDVSFYLAYVSIP